jgi:predicted nuclease with TOPRIM domain
LAKSTLLRALQNERNNVDELEAAVTSLQQNNSAIAEMVKSRDLIIDELNDRVAVFEEDKVVLKAALKQLQKEMKVEAPRTQKLIDELEVARQGKACAWVEFPFYVPLVLLFSC